MPEVSDDYVLGTHDAEVERLGLQHRVWRESMLAACRRAGLRPGHRVVDVGSGPGYAALDLAELVGPAGEVLAVERSRRFVDVLREESRRRGLAQLSVEEGDLMNTPPPSGFDLTWCRWVASFAGSVPRLVRWIHDALRPGGTAIFHEYADYGSWRFAPPRPLLQDFVAEVMASWRASGGEPDVAPALIEALRREGFRLRAVRPLVFATIPGEPTWRWPAAFVATNARRLSDLGRVSGEWAGRVVAELVAAEADPESVMLTPLVLEVIADRP
jgi:SAM-dependent methyltransferase